MTASVWGIVGSILSDGGDRQALIVRVGNSERTACSFQPWSGGSRRGIACC